MSTSEGFTLALHYAKDAFGKLSAENKEELLSYITVAYAAVDAFANGRTDRVTGQKIPIESVKQLVSQCTTKMREQQLEGLASLLDASATQVEREGPSAMRLGMELHLTKKAFRKKTGDGQDGGSDRPDGTVYLGTLAEKRVPRHRWLQAANTKKPEEIMEMAGTALEGLTPSGRAEVYSAARFGTEIEGLEKQAQQIRQTMEEIQALMMLAPAVLALLNPALGAATALGAVASMLSHSLTQLTKPEKPAEALTAEIARQHEIDDALSAGHSRHRHSRNDGPSMGGARGGSR